MAKFQIAQEGVEYVEQNKPMTSALGSFEREDVAILFELRERRETN